MSIWMVEFWLWKALTCLLTEWFLITSQSWSVYWLLLGSVKNLFGFLLSYAELFHNYKQPRRSSVFTSGKVHYTVCVPALKPLPYVHLFCCAWFVERPLDVVLFAEMISAFIKKKKDLFTQGKWMHTQFVQLVIEHTHSLNPCVNIWLHWAGRFTVEELNGFWVFSQFMCWLWPFVCFRVHVQHAEKPG